MSSLVFLLMFCQNNWAKAYGGSSVDEPWSVHQTSDNGYVVAGATSSYGAGGHDFLVVKLDSTGGLQWAKTIGGGDSDEARSVHQTSDNGYIVAGWTQCYGAGYWDFLVVKLSSTGGVEWAKTIGGVDNDWDYSVHQTSDNGYIVAGGTCSYGAGVYDFLVVKLDSTGGLQWAKTIGGGGGDVAHSVYQTSDNGYIVAGGTQSYGAGYWDFLVVKFNSTGGLQWAKTIGGDSSDIAYSLQQTSDNGYIVVGATLSYGAGVYDFLVVKLNSTGGVQWTKTIGGADNDFAFSVQQTSDNGYIVAGWTRSYGAGSVDFLLVKLNSTGGVQWTKTIGGGSYDEARSVRQTHDNRYIVAGRTDSYGAGGGNFLVVKLEPDGSMAPNCPIADWHPDTASPIPTVTSPSLSTSSPSVGASCTPTITAPSPPVITICESGVEIIDPHPVGINLLITPSIGKQEFDISYELPVAGDVSLKIYDLCGRVVKILVNEYKSAGVYRIGFSAANNRSGIYFCKLIVNDRGVTKKFIIQSGRK